MAGVTDNRLDGIEQREAKFERSLEAMRKSIAEMATALNELVELPAEMRKLQSRIESLEQAQRDRQAVVRFVESAWRLGADLLKVGFGVSLWEAWKYLRGT